MSSERSIQSTKVVSVQLIGRERFDWVADQCSLIFVVDAQAL